MIELEIESLVVPGVHAAEETDKLLQDFPRLWSLVNLEEQRKLLVNMLDAVYIDTKNNLIVAIKPKPPFRPVCQVAASPEGSDIRIINEPFESSSLFLVRTDDSPISCQDVFGSFIHENFIGKSPVSEDYPIAAFVPGNVHSISSTSHW